MLRIHRLNEMEEDLPFEVDEALLDELVELVGSEEEVEFAAEESYNELQEAVQNDGVELNDSDIPEKLVIAALLVKLVESGKLDPEDADGLLEKYLS
jgi:FKBP-type peptidyl-prolyl cis-trans isomerase (trigger factor)